MMAYLKLLGDVSYNLGHKKLSQEKFLVAKITKFVFFSNLNITKNISLIKLTDLKNYC